MKIANITISRRLFMGFGLLMLLIAAMAVIGINRLANLDTQMNDVINDKYPKTVMAGDIIDQLNLIARSVRNILLLKDKQQIESENARIAGAERAIQAQIAQLDKQLVDEESRMLLGNLLTAQKNYQEKIDKVFQLVATDNKDKAIDMLINEVRPVQNAYMDAAEKMIQKQRIMMQRSGETVEKSYQSASNILF
eukprot:gene21489-22364_t